MSSLFLKNNSDTAAQPVVPRRIKPRKPSLPHPPFRKKWCRRGDSNPYGKPHTPLKRARLPIPPLRHCKGGGIIEKKAAAVNRAVNITPQRVFGKGPLLENMLILEIFALNFRLIGQKSNFVTFDLYKIDFGTYTCRAFRNGKVPCAMEMAHGSLENRIEI